jgi:hypothetical protein
MDNKSDPVPEKILSHVIPPSVVLRIIPRVPMISPFITETNCISVQYIFEIEIDVSKPQLKPLLFDLKRAPLLHTANP